MLIAALRDYGALKDDEAPTAVTDGASGTANQLP